MEQTERSKKLSDYSAFLTNFIVSKTGAQPYHETGEDGSTEAEA